MELENFTGELKEVNEYFHTAWDGSYARTDLVFFSKGKLVVLHGRLENKSDYVRRFFLGKKVTVKHYSDGFWSPHWVTLDDIALADSKEAS